MKRPYRLTPTVHKKKRIVRETGKNPRLTTSYGILFQMDCLDLLARVRSESIHCASAHLPFNLNKEYKNGFQDDAREERQYLEWCYRWVEEASRVLIPGGGLVRLLVAARWSYLMAARLDESMQFRNCIALTMKGTFPRGQKGYPAHYAL